MTKRTLITGEILSELETVVLYDILHECACNDKKSLLVRGTAAKFRDALFNDAEEIKAKYDIKDNTSKVSNFEEIRIFEEIRVERKRQDEKFGEQNYPMVGKTLYDILPEDYPRSDLLRRQIQKCKERSKTDQFCWFDILLEEICEAFLETEPERQREEMIQVAAVAVAIIEYLDKRGDL